MIKLIKDNDARTVQIIKDEKEIATICIDKLDDLVNDFGLTSVICIEV